MFGLVVFIGLTPTKRQTQFSENTKVRSKEELSNLSLFPLASLSHWLNLTRN